MREIKFRGLSTDGHGWLYGYLVKGNNSYLVTEESMQYAVVSHNDHASLSLFQVVPESVGQFTGLIDKNGEEVFDGDIVKLHAGHPSWIQNPFEIVFQNHAFAFKQPDRKGSTAICVYLNDCVKAEVITETSQDDWLVEVIGNVHEHPDLLTKL